MINQAFIYAVRFLGLVLIQVLVINNLDISFYVNPYIYPLFILLIRFQTPHWLLMIIAFFTGLTIDAFSNTMGMHAAASVLIAFLRPFILRIITPRHSYENIDEPKLEVLGYTWFITYIAIMIFWHHLLYFFVEAFSFDNFFITLSKVLISTVVSSALILFTLMIFSPAGKRRSY